MINASPLILLSRGGHPKLLRPFARRIFVPQPVADEALRRGQQQQDPTARALAETDWLQVASVPPIPETILAWALGPGESAVLGLALTTPRMVAIIDDPAGRKCAHGHGIPVRGTLGIILAAKKTGVIPLARPVMEEFIRAGLYLSRSVLDEALRRMGE